MFVCTGNRCRSPFAAVQLNALAAEFAASESSGLLDLGPVPSTDEGIEVARSFGVDLSGHAAQWIGNVDLSDYDAVIGFERAHIATAVVEAGADYGRAFLLPELARLLSSLEPIEEDGDDVDSRATDLIRRAHEARGDFVPGEEVADPIGRSVDVYKEVYSEIRALLADITSILFATADRGTTPTDSLKW
jgi:protein-tyrosine phosphatase